MCIVRDFEDEKFQIHQNGKLAYSFGDCRTVPANETCLKRGWKYSSKYRYVDFSCGQYMLLLIAKMSILFLKTKMY